jgi:hypothetical protein
MEHSAPRKVDYSAHFQMPALISLTRLNEQSHPWTTVEKRANKVVKTFHSRIGGGALLRTTRFGLECRKDNL